MLEPRKSPLPFSLGALLTSVACFAAVLAVVAGLLRGGSVDFKLLLDFQLLLFFFAPLICVLSICLSVGLPAGRPILSTLIGLLVGGIANYLWAIWIIQGMLRAWK